MADRGAESPSIARSKRGADADEGDPFDELRGLLIGPEQDRLRALQARLEDPEAQARALATAVRRNPRPLADALFPIMGPAIRKAIAHALSGMVESLNQALEHSLSPKALRWRLTAWRTGRPFSEVVLANTLLYRVEQIFLIHRTSGLVVDHVSAASVEVQDAGMVSGMLTAIRDFVHDSFGGDEQDSLDTFQVGELAVWIEQGPAAVLAAVVRGSAPAELRTSLADALEAIHLQCADELQSFSGDSAPFASLRPVLEDCLRSRYRETRGATSSRAAWALAAVVVLALAAWVFLSARAEVRWSRYLDRLKAEPGIVVISSTRENGRRVLRGLRDPLAADPASLLDGSGVRDGDVDGRWQLYQALEPALIQRRAIEMLRPPADATLELSGGTLSASGRAPAEWIRDSRRLARLVPGVVRYDDAALADGDLERLKTEIEATRLLFVVGTAELVAGQDAALRALRENVLSLGLRGRDSGQSLRLSIVGHTDADGAPDLNLPLSQARADAVRKLLQGSADVEIVAVGVGSDQPASAPGSEDSKRQNRSVSFRAEPSS